MILSIPAYHGLSAVPIPDPCENGYYEPINSGQTVVENGEKIDGAIRIDRRNITSFDTVGHVGNIDGARVFAMNDGRKFILIDRFNSTNYVIGYEVVPCRKRCTPCPGGCRKELQNEIFYARPTRQSISDIPVIIARKTIKCLSNKVPTVSCQ